jgi:hypothetical protein
VSRRGDEDDPPFDIRLFLAWMAYGAADLAVTIWAWVHFDVWAAAACFVCSFLGGRGSDALLVLVGKRKVADLP